METIQTDNSETCFDLINDGRYFWVQTAMQGYSKFNTLRGLKRSVSMQLTATEKSVATLVAYKTTDSFFTGYVTTDNKEL